MCKQIITLMISTLVWTISPAFAMENQEHQGSTRKVSTWNFLKSQDKIEIIAPAAAPLSTEQVEVAQSLIRLHGLKPYLPEGAIDKENSLYGYYANSTKKRTHHFKEALLGDSKALWFLRGGFGCEGVVEELEDSLFVPPHQPKSIIGFSDATALHLLAATWKWPSLHAPVVGLGQELFSVTKSEVNKQANLFSVINVLKGDVKQLEHTFDVISPGDTPTEAPILGSVMGGNLSILENHKGTSTALQGKDRFVFFEDTAEDGKRLNRRLVGLARAHVFDEAKGIIIGNLPLIGHETVPEETKKIIKHFITESLLPKDINIPVVYSSRFGHGAYNDVMPLGTTAYLTIGEKKAILKVSVNESAYPLE
jgi:muramoyltetrapeptide carboxypeptidase